MKIQSGVSGCWMIWSLLTLAVAGIHLLTIRISPPVWQDEVQIIEFGRAVMPGSDRSWSAVWNPAGRPERVLPYLGCGIQEIAYRTAGGDLAGPRTTALLGAILASAAMLGWLRARGLDWRVALAISLLFLIDPILAQSYRGARVDAGCMGFMLLALWAIRATPRNDHLDRPLWKPRSGNFVAALCVALSGLVWPSAILLVPLLLHELCFDWNEKSDGGRVKSWARPAREVAWVGSLSLIMLGLLLLPASREIRLAIADLTDLTTAASAPKTGGSFGFESLKNSVGRFAEVFKYNPWAILIGAALCLSTARWPLALALAAALAGAFLTGIYVHRAVYLLPYLFLSVALVADKFVKIDRSRMCRRLVGFALTAMILWSAGVTLGARTVVALMERDARDYQHMRDLVAEPIGQGPHRVYLGSWELYYAGRQLGWRLFCFIGGAPPGSQIWNDLMKTMDFAIFRDNYLTDREDDALRELGFTRERFDCDRTGPAQSNRMRNLAAGYGSYWIYRRQ